MGDMDILFPVPTGGRNADDMGMPAPIGWPATRTVHCPSGPVHACDLHASQITGLMRFLGAHAAHTMAPDGAQCENCKNEAATKTPNV